MAKHIITISDTGFGVAIHIAGSNEETPTKAIAMALVEHAKVIFAEMDKQAANGCDCPKCRARRQSAGQKASTNSKPTLH